MKNILSSGKSILKSSLFFLFIMIYFAGLSQPPDWTFDPNQQYNMNVIAKLQYSDESFSLDENDLIAAFVDDECRGINSPIPDADGLIFLTILSNQSSGEFVTFMAYIAEEDRVVELEQTIVFNEGDLVGSGEDPFIFTYIESYNLNLLSEPADGGVVTGEGQYPEDEVVSINATANTGYVFTGWSGDVQYVDNPDNAATNVTMPASDVNLTANFIPQVPDVDDLTVTYDGTQHTIVASVPPGFTVAWYSNAEGGSEVSAPTGTNVGEYSAWAASVDGNGFESERVQATLTIETRALTVTADDQTKVVGIEFTFAGTEFTISGLVDNGIDEVTNVSLTSEGAPSGAAIGTYPIIASNATGTGLNNYNISYQEGTFTVTDQFELTLEGFTVADKIYDGNITATISNFGTLTGIQDGDDVSIDEEAIVAQFSDENAGTDKVVSISNLILTGDDANKYFIDEFTVNASITPRALVLSNFSASSKVYDGTTLVNNPIFSDNRITGDNLELTFDAAFEDPNAGTNKTINFTNIAISGGVDQANYILQTTTGTTQATINRASLQIAAEDKSKTYDGDVFTDFTVIYTGFVANEDESVLSGTLGFGAEAENAVNVGTYNIQPQGVTSNNYNITFNSATLSITRAPLIIEADNKSKTYDGNVFDDFTVTYTGFVGGEDESVLEGTLQFSGAAIGAINVGSYTISASGLTSDNYNITFEQGNLSITPAILTITAEDKSKVYDKQVFTGFTVVYDGFVAGEDPSVLEGTLQFSGNAVTATNAGTYTITPEGYSATNYDIDFISGTLTITLAELTITADDQTKVYNAQVFTGFTVSFDGFVGSDTESDLGGSLTINGGAATSIDVGSYVIIPGGYTSTNYDITFVNGNLSINPASLTVTADNKEKVYDAAVFAEFTVSYSGFAGDDDPSDLGGSLSFSGNAVSAVNVGTYTIVPEGLTSGNYNITFNNGTLSITSAPLTITAENKSKVYDGQEFTAFTVVYDGFVGGEDPSNLQGSLSFSGMAVGAVNAGDYEIIPGGFTSQNYSINYVNGSLSITPAELTIIADDKSKAYDGQVFTAFTVSYAGFVSGEDETNLEGTLSFAGNAVTAVNAGTYTIQPQGLTSNNYEISFINGELVITSIALTVTADDKSKVYDGNEFSPFTVTFDGFISGEDESNLGGNLSFSGDATNATDVGTYAIIPSGYTSPNYDISYVNGELTITPRALAITANDISKTVGVELVFEGTEFTTTGLVNNEIDEVTSVTLTSAGAPADAEVGTYVINISDAQGVALENYTISYVNGTLTVTDKILLAISGLQAENKVYDGTTTATISDFGTLVGVQPGDDVSIDTDLAVASFGNKNVGTDKSVTLSNILLIGEDAINYTINNQSTSADITPRPLNLSGFTANNKPYDGTATVTGAAFDDDRINGDALNFTFSAAFESPDAGIGKTVNFTNIQISGGTDAINYQLITTSGQTTADIIPILLTITANDEQKVYNGQVFTGFSVVYEGFISGENESVLQGTLSFSGDATTAVNAGEYDIVPGNLTSNNYDITFVPGTLAITPAALTVTANDQSKVYDAQTFTAFTVSYSGFEGDDGPGDLEGSLTFAGTAPSAVNVGDYTIIPQGLTSNNYNITFEQGTLTITPAPLTITADDKTKVYDGQVFTAFTVSYSGFVGNEDQSVLQGTLQFSGNATTSVNVGTYEIVPHGLSSGNYSIGFVSGELSITPAFLTVTADDKSRAYNGQVFTAFTVSYAGFVSGEGPENLQGTLEYTGPAVTAINAGEYAIIPQGLTSTNYNISFVQGTLTITQASLSITADNKSKVYDGVVFTAFTVSYSGFVGGEDESVLEGTLGFSGNAVTAVNAGTYQIIPGGLTSNNYNITFSNGTLTISRAPLSITADDKSKVYDGQLFTAFTVTYSGFVTGEGPENLSGTLTFSGSAVTAINVGAYIINPGGLSSNNYNISYSPGTLSITRAPLSITADDKTKVYDGGVFQGFTATYAGFVNGEGPSDLQGTLSFTGAAVTAINVGNYIITPQGHTSNNYNISYSSGSLSITVAPLTIIADDQVKPVGTELVFEGTEFNTEGLVENDIVESVTLFSNGAPASAPIGNYPILISNAQGQGLSNYSIAYVQGTLSVTDKIVLTLSGLTAENKVYDGTRTATISDYGTLVGVEPGTDVQLDTSQATALFNNKNVGNNKTVTVSNLDLTGDDAAMYTIGSQTTQANISPRNLTLSNFVANDKVYDGNTIVTGAGFDDDRINDDVLSFTYNVAFENADAGIDKQVLFTNITISGGTDQNNYTLVSTSGVATATITPRPLAITADSKSKKFGEDDPALTYTLTSGSLIGNDTFSGAPEREPGEDLGEYAILQGTLTAGSNYAITFTQGVFTIQPADLIVFIVPQAAITAGAQWSIDGETWYNSGTALPLAPGDYTVQFSEIDANAWYTPDPVSVEHGAQTEITGTYVEKYFLTMLEPQGNGSVTPAPGVYDYPVNQEVNLSATPDDDWVFQHWLINGNTVANNPYNITITENTEVQAVFAEDMTEYLLTLNTEGEGSVLVNGDTYTQPMTFVNGSQVLLEAVAEQGWIFTGWEGDLTGSENPTSIIIDGDKNITATFEFVAFDVTFNIVDDEGDPIEGASVLLGEIINEPGDYVFEDVPPGIYNYIVSKTGYITVSSEVEISEDTIIDVTLVPGVSPQYTITFLITNEDGFLVNDAVVTFAGITNPEGNYVFPGIEAGLYSYSVEREGYYTATGNVSVSADMTVPVVLEFSFYLLEIEHEGLGITVPDVGIYEVDKDTIVTLQAFSVENSLFSKWVVDGNEYFDTQIEFIMDSDKLAVAHFDSTATYKLSIVVEGEGTTIPAEGDYYYGFDQVVELIALDANENYSFLKWVVDGIDYFENQINVVMNDDIIATAIFTENTFYTLDIEIEGEGTTDPEPGVYQYLEGTEIELSAIADEGYAFVRWEINGEEFLTSVISVQMNENKNAKAVFDIESIVDDSFTRFYDVIVYPVPSAETITMRFEGYSGKAFVEIFDLNGRMVRQLQIQNIIPAHEETIMISDLEPGVYSLKIQLQNEIIIKRFIVR